MPPQDEEKNAESEMFFIVGFQRSGTTLLRALLNQSASVCIPPESSFLTFFWEEFGNWADDCKAGRVEEFVDRLKHARKIQHWELDWQSLRAVIRDECPADYPQLILLVYRLYCASKGKEHSTIGDKNNIHGTELILIRNLFPSARIIHVVRDPRDVFASEQEFLKSAKEEELNLVPKIAPGAINFALRWRRYFEQITQDRVSHRDKHLTVIYEDLVWDTPGQLRRVHDFLSLPPIENLGQDRGIRFEPEFELSWKRNVLKPVTPASVGRFKRDNSYLSNQILSWLLRRYLKWIALRRTVL